MVWAKWAVLSYKHGELVSLHDTEEQCIAAAIKASTDGNAIFSWVEVRVVAATRGTPTGLDDLGGVDDADFTPRTFEGAP